MGRPNRFQILQHVKPLIEKSLRKHSALKGRAFSKKDIDLILNESKYLWSLPNVTTTIEFINFLSEKNILTPVSINLNEKITNKYLFGDVHEYEVSLSLRNNSYLTHYTALFLNNLTENIPKNIYTNMEQTKKPIVRGVLEQSNIDSAFERPMRKTNQIAQYDKYKIYLLNGKNVENLGVIDYKLEKNITVKVTNMERTLIDVTVRPDYAGGIEEVLNAYKAAKGMISVNKLTSYLKKMNYIYPYHQAIGFYLEKAGYEEKLFKLLEKTEIKYNFYLTYNMKEKTFNNRWKLFVPKRF